MKRCPECNSLFDDAEHFCELDGAPLVAGANEEEAKVVERRAEPRRQPINRALVPIVAVAGIGLGVLLFMGYLAITREPAQEPVTKTTRNSAVAQQQVPDRPLQLAPLPSPSVSASPSPSPSPSPSVR